MSQLTLETIGGTRQQYEWYWQGQQLSIAYDILGEGKTVLLLPALSSVSTRGEMGELAKSLASQFQVVAVDWPGFGQSSRPPLDYRPSVYHQFIEDFVKNVINTPAAVVAAGHAAGYAMKLAKTQPDIFSHIVLAAPTWRGPLPTMGLNEEQSNILREIVRSPILGEMLYALNTIPPFLNFMYRGHVFAKGDILTDNFIQQKWQTTQQQDARFASAAFVTGALDPVQNRSEFLAWFKDLSIPVMVAIGEQSPPKSKAEMESLSQLPGVQSRLLPGSLGLHEEYADKFAEVIIPFLNS
ncbi:alpha/beta fold hydrolase [Aerosakkonema sp. BLCC-F183]|uniref:alpha/beta fold hydrolase n=1 Tax=Aerosakkonema sp. BLCC-F183 TaxID=3342834 RepID=UPI0035B971EA